MKILFILPEYYPHAGAGISSYYLHYIKALKPYCEKIKVIVGSGYLCSDEVHKSGEVEVEYLKVKNYHTLLKKFSKFDLLPEFRNNLAAAWAMYDQAGAGEGFDIVECTDFGLGFIPWVISHHKPVVTRLHGSSGQIHLYEDEGRGDITVDFFKQAESLLLPLSDQVITHSGSNLRFWQAALGKDVMLIDPVYSSYSANPISLAQRENYGLVCGRLQRWKGPVQLCEAFSGTDPIPKSTIKWFGRDMPFSAGISTNSFLKNKYPNVWGKKISYHKQAPNETIISLQSKVKFGLIPSTWDMFNFTCPEFLAVGTPVICSEGAGASDLIEHGLNGFKYPALDTYALVDCMQKLSALTGEEYQKMASLAIETIKNRLSPQAVLPDNLNSYQRVVKNFQPRIANDYLKGIYEPSDRPYHFGDILDKISLKRLMSYLLKRTRAKIVSNR